MYYIYIHIYIYLFGVGEVCDILVESHQHTHTHIALITFSKQVAGSVAVAVVITSELAVTLSWADLMSVGLLSYLPKNRSTGCGVVVPSLKLTVKAPEN